MGTSVAAAIFAVYRRLKLLALTLSPSNEADLESDRAGRQAELQVASIFGGIPGVQVYQSLRIPDTGHRGRREIDLVLVTKRELFVIEVKNWSGLIQLDPDGTWSQIRRNGTIQKHPNVVEETKYRATLLIAYLERRGVTVPHSYVQSKVFLVNPGCRPEQAIMMQPEVLLADQWEHFLDQSVGNGLSGRMKNILGGLKSDCVLSDTERKQLHFVLSTAPTWDRLVLEGGKIVVGDFQKFQGQPEDMENLKFAKRSAVSHLAMSHGRGWLGNIFGFAIGRSPKVRIAMTIRDYREGNANLSNKKQNSKPPTQSQVRPDTEVVFHPVGSSKTQRFNMSDILALSLSS